MEHAEKVAAMMKEKFGLGHGADLVLEFSGAELCVQLGKIWRHICASWHGQGDRGTPNHGCVHARSNDQRLYTVPFRLLPSSNRIDLTR